MLQTTEFPHLTSCDLPRKPFGMIWNEVSSMRLLADLESLRVQGHPPL